MNDTTIDHDVVEKDNGVHTAKPANFAKVEAPEGVNGKADTEVMGDDRNLDTILGIPVDIQVVLGSATMLVSNLLKLGRGAVIPLNHRVGEPIDIVVNGRVIARGEVVVVEDDNSRFGVSLTEIISSQTGALEA
ncbi:flagellar motor switch protein FliN [Labrenzia aggregata]|uniref:Flagellar motor switch protein FliN n=2 Tax=Stappiaceae TaxID=2821832 RepID=A0A926NQW7_9HYPH|nr:flagellar motor switch protein FliN [Roseibium aggregatum]